MIDDGLLESSVRLCATHRLGDELTYQSGRSIFMDILSKDVK